MYRIGSPAPQSAWKTRLQTISPRMEGVRGIRRGIFRREFRSLLECAISGVRRAVRQLARLSL